MKAQVLSFHCVLKNRFGKVISSTFNQDVFTHGHGEYLQGLSEGLVDLKAGEKRQIVLSAQQAYGFYDLNLVMEISRKKLTQGRMLKVGDEVLIPTKNKLKTFRVIQESQSTLTLDGNHPLAGQDLIFDVEGVQMRDASPEEVEEIRLDSFTHFFH